MDLSIYTNFDSPLISKYVLDATCQFLQSQEEPGQESIFEMIDKVSLSEEAKQGLRVIQTIGILNKGMTYASTFKGTKSFQMNLSLEQSHDLFSHDGGATAMGILNVLSINSMPTIKEQYDDEETKYIIDLNRNLPALIAREGPGLPQVESMNYWL